jgi:hypothetical protein
MPIAECRMSGLGGGRLHQDISRHWPHGAGVRLQFQVPQRQERDDAAFSLPCVPTRLPAGDEYPAGAVAAGCGGRVAGVALHVLTLVVRGAGGRPARRGDRTEVFGSSLILLNVLEGLEDVFKLRLNLVLDFRPGQPRDISLNLFPRELDIPGMAQALDFDSEFMLWVSCG